MGRSQKSKRVIWASDVNLCQVRLFLSEDSPSQVGSGTQDHLQAKASWAEQSGVGSDDNLPPGFEGHQHSNLWRAKLSQIPLIKWTCPPGFKINNDWRVVAGEESSETEAQNQRELRVLEAIYPRPSAIPPNPTSSADEFINNDQNTPLVPITPIEDEDAALDGTTSANSSPVISQPSDTFSSTEGGATPDIVAAAQVAVSAIMSNSDSTTLIDRDLLVKILSDPKMVEQLVKNHTAASSSTQNMTSSSSFRSMPQNMNTISSSMQNVLPSSSSEARPPIASQSNMTSTSTQYSPHISSIPKSSFDMVNISKPEMVKPSISVPAGTFYPISTMRPPITNQRSSAPDHVIPPPPSSLGVTVKKDINYYKSLIQQHGAEKREIMPQFGTSHEQLSKSLIQQHGVERRDILPPQFGYQSNQPLGTSQEPPSTTHLSDSKPKIMKPCIYFNTSRGCRNGANCLYQHDVSSRQRVSGIPEVQSAKRVKLDREITGT